MMIFELNQLGQAPTPSSTSEAIGAYVAGLRDSVLGSKKSAVNAYNTLKSVRSNLGLPFMSSGGEGGDQNGWSPDLEQQAVDVVAMANILTAAADDVLAQKRKLYWDDKLQNFAVEGLPGDVLRLQLDANGVPVLVDANGNQQHVTGQVGAVPVIVMVGVAAIVLIQALIIYLLIDKALQTLQVIAEQQTQKTLAQAVKKHADLVASGKATADDAAKLNKSMYEGATELQKQSTSAQGAKKGFESDTLKTLGYIALGLGVLYAVVKFMPKPSGSPAMAAPALNPGHREPGDETAADELELYIENDSRFAIHGQGQGRAISENLWKKWKKGTYESSRAPQAWSYVVESAAKAYAKEFDSPGNWSRIFNPATRGMVAHSLAKKWEDEARSGEFERYPPAA
jgi:hypothetical protein